MLLKLSNILYKDLVTSEEVRRKIQAAIGEYDELLTMVKKRKIVLAKTVLQGTVKEKRRGRQKKRWQDNIREWTGMDLASPIRQLKTGQGGLLGSHLWCLNHRYLGSVTLCILGHLDHYP